MGVAVTNSTESEVIIKECSIYFLHILVRRFQHDSHLPNRINQNFQHLPRIHIKENHEGKLL